VDPCLLHSALDYRALARLGRRPVASPFDPPRDPPFGGSYEGQGYAISMRDSILHCSSLALPSGGGRQWRMALLLMASLDSRRWGSAHHHGGIPRVLNEVLSRHRSGS